ncbi:hypothetical protein G6F32_016765 [Rhizopus arrhizus]|nr:hypothetical protein G6F32_016765 [Rhizopus arrhizus]
MGGCADARVFRDFQHDVVGRCLILRKHFPDTLTQGGRRQLNRVQVECKHGGHALPAQVCLHRQPLFEHCLEKTVNQATGHDCR